MRAGDIPFVVVQTAASVNAFSDDMAVLLRDGVKRTVPSRWPDSSSPMSMSSLRHPTGCIWPGSASCARCSRRPPTGTWRTRRAWMTRSMPRSSPCSATAPKTCCERRPGCAARQRSGAARGAGRPDGADRYRDGGGGPDRPAVRHRAPAQPPARHGGGRGRARPSAFHGAQVGVASVLAATVWHDTLDRFDPTALERDDVCPSDPAKVERRVHDAFDPVDPSGRMADECWRDVGRKLDRWRMKRAGIAAFVADWDRHRTELRALVATPDQLRTRSRMPGRQPRSPSSTRRRQPPRCAGPSARCL